LVSCVVIVFLAFGCECKTATYTENFEDYFRKVKEVKLYTSLVSTINFLDVTGKGRFLVTDRRRGEVVLYDSSGHILRNLSEEIDHAYPGFNWSPTRGFFMKDHSIFVANNYPWGVRFDADGRFYTVMDEPYRATYNITFDSEKNIYAFVSNHTGTYLKKIDSTGTELFRFGTFPEEFENLINKVVVGNNLILDSDGNLFHKYLATPTIYKYDKEGVLLDRFAKYPGYFKETDRDITKYGGNQRRLMREISHFLGNYTSNYSIHLLAEDLILVQYLINRQMFGLQFITTEGDYIEIPEIVIKERVWAAKNGFIYFIKETGEDGKPLISPEVHRYQFRGY